MAELVLFHCCLYLGASISLRLTLPVAFAFLTDLFQYIHAYETMVIVPL